MGHIKEPIGIDFVINSRPLTNEEEIAISEYIRSYKTKHSHKEIISKQTVKNVLKKKSTSVRKKVIA